MVKSNRIMLARQNLRRVMLLCLHCNILSFIHKSVTDKCLSS